MSDMEQPELPASYLDGFRAALEGPLPANVAKVLDAAAEHGWQENPVVSLTIRLAKPDDKPEPRSGAVAQPFFATWTMHVNPETGKRGWRFHSARCKNGQPLSFGDVFAVLEHPEFAYPDPPDISAEPSESEK